MLKFGPVGIDNVPVQSGATVGSYPSGGVDDNRALDVHRAEWIERRTISVESEALQKRRFFRASRRNQYAYVRA